MNKAGEWSWVVPVKNSLIGTLHFRSILTHFRFVSPIVSSESWINHGKYDQWRTESN